MCVGGGVYLGLRIFFSQDFSPKNKKCSEWHEMQKNIHFFLGTGTARVVSYALAHQSWDFQSGRQ